MPTAPQASFKRPVEVLRGYAAKGGGGVDLSGGGGAAALERAARDALRRHPKLATGAPLTEKVVVVGDQNVGKTCLALRCCENLFPADYKATVGVDFLWKRYTVHGVPFTLHVWDTAGQERFTSLSAAYYRGARACVSAFDITHKPSLQGARRWVAEVLNENTREHEAGEMCVFLVGTKLDLAGEQREVSVEEGEAAARDMGAEYFEVSAKAESNVRHLFERLACVLFERALRRAVGQASSVARRPSPSDGRSSTVRLEAGGRGRRRGEAEPTQSTCC